MKILLAGPGTGKTTNIKKIISEYGGGEKFLILSFTKATVRDLQISLQELGVSDMNCMTLHKFAIKYNHDKNRHVLLPTEEEKLTIIAKAIHVEFNNFCDFLECTTFDQIVGRFVKYAKSNPLYLKEKLSNYDFLIVDEYQDFNSLEQNLIDLIIKTINTSFLLGDDDQCIYDFRDASNDKIISLHLDDKNEKISHEHICYRCPDKVVEHATNLIMHNRKRVVKKWEKSGKEGVVEYAQLRSLNDIADFVAQKIKNITGSVLILTPVKFSILPLIEKLKNENIDFENFFKESVSLELMTKVWELRSIFGKYMYINLVFLGYFLDKNRKKFYNMLKNHFDNGKNYDELFKFLEKKLNHNMISCKNNLESFLSNEFYAEILNLYNNSEGKNSDEKIENIFKETEGYENKNIKIMSIHKSKGLDADYVFMVGLVEGIIPNVKKGNDSIEAQRRLFYVGMTRAKKNLYLLCNIDLPGKHANTVNKSEFKFDRRSKIWKGKASSFIDELKLL